jgi:hypothetical protein
MSIASAVERAMLDLINAERAAVGVAPLKLELRLNDAAETHSDWMLDADVFSHTGAGGSSAGARMSASGFDFSGSWSWGENIAWQSERGAAGVADDVANLHVALMNSPGHRANLLNPNFDYVGIGVEVGEYRGWEAVMVTQVFARTGAPVQLDPGTTPPEPEPANRRPSVAMEDLTLSPGTRVAIAPLLTVTDPDGDAAVRFRVRDLTGADSFVLNGKVIGADPRRDLRAERIDELEVQAGAPGTEEVLQIRVFDGQTWGKWDSFTVRTEVDGARSADLWEALLAELQGSDGWA